MNNQGITKIEILVIAFIIGVLGIAAATSVSSARSRTRDAVRLSDVRQTQAALELYFNDQGMYPATEEVFALGQASTRCLSQEGFSASCTPTIENVYMEVVSPAPKGGLKGLSSCSDIGNAYCYTATNAEFRIKFELENNNTLLGVRKGLNCATEKGLVAGACPALASGS